MQLIDPTMKRFKFEFFVNESDRLYLNGVVEEMIEYCSLKNVVYMHLNYVFENVFLYRIFTLEGTMLDYRRGT